MKLMTAKDLARDTPFSYRFWLNEMKQSKLKCIKNGRKYATTQKWLDEYLENQTIDELTI